MNTTRCQIQRNLSSFILIIATSLYSSFVLSTNDNFEQCRAFRESHATPIFISHMLEAASKGFLYQIKPNASNIAFQVNHFPFSTVEGSFNIFNGGLTLPEDNRHSRQAIFVIKADSMNTGNEDLDDYLKSNVFFNITEFPNITFVSTDFEWISETTARLRGNLTMRDTTRSIEFLLQISSSNSNNHELLISATAEIHRSEFGMHELSLLVSDKVTFNINLIASRVDMASN